MMITANNGFIEQSERYAFNNAGESLKKYILLKKGELAYNHGASKLRPYGSCFALTTAENARIPFVYHCFSAENQNAEFMSIELNGAEIENQLRKIVSSGARMDGLLNISFDEYTSVSVLLPGTEEQDRIADFFRHLDNLITLHQRKCVFLFGFFQAFISMIFTASTFSWEQRKLSEMCGTFEYGLNAAAKEFDGNNKYIRITDIDDASREFLLSDLSSPDICLDGMSKYLLSSGDIVFARTGASVGKTYIYRENDGIVYFAGFLIRAKVNQDNDAEFVFQSTLSPSYEKYIRITSQRSGQPGVNAQEYGEYDLFAPSKEEQQRIGHFLRGIDNLITLHQRQSFSHSTPDISLSVQLIHPFYTSSWEQRKLGELVDRVVRKNTNNESTLPLTISAQYGLVDQITYFNNRVASRDVSNYYLVLNGEFAYNKSTSDGYPFGAVKRLDLYEKGVLSTLYIVFAPKKEQQIDSDYLTVFFDTDRWHKGVAERAAEGARNHGLLNISAEDFFDIDLSVPKDIVEQKQIGAFIRQLDSLITLHQRKGKAAVSGCSNDANNSKGVYCKARDFGYKCYKEVKSQQIRCLIAVFIFCV